MAVILCSRTHNNGVTLIGCTGYKRWDYLLVGRQEADREWKGFQLNCGRANLKFIQFISFNYF